MEWKQFISDELYTDENFVKKINLQPKLVCIVPGPTTVLAYRRHLINVQLLKSKTIQTPVRYLVLFPEDRRK